MKQGISHLLSAVALSAGLTMTAAGGIAAASDGAGVQPGSSAASMPDPCALAPAALVAPALGVPPSSLHATLQHSTADGFHLATCIFLHGSGVSSTHVDVVLAPAAFGQGSSGGIPGLVTTHPSGLGPHGMFLYDQRPGNVFASAVFLKDGLWGEAYSSAHVPPAHDLALGRYAYAHLT